MFASSEVWLLQSYADLPNPGLAAEPHLTRYTRSDRHAGTQYGAARGVGCGSDISHSKNRHLSGAG